MVEASGGVEEVAAPARSESVTDGVMVGSVVVGRTSDDVSEVDVDVDRVEDLDVVEAEVEVEVLVREEDEDEDEDDVVEEVFLDVVELLLVVVVFVVFFLVEVLLVGLTSDRVLLLSPFAAV